MTNENKKQKRAPPLAQGFGPPLVVTKELFV